MDRGPAPVTIATIIVLFQSPTIFGDSHSLPLLFSLEFFFVIDIWLNSSFSGIIQFDLNSFLNNQHFNMSFIPPTSTTTFCESADVLSQSLFLPLYDFVEYDHCGGFSLSSGELSCEQIAQFLQRVYAPIRKGFETSCGSSLQR